MKRSASIVILCEDMQHYNFVRRFLILNGWDSRRIRVNISSGGSAEQFVREQFPIELRAYRSRKTYQKSMLFVVTDADTGGVVDRISEFKSICETNGIEFRAANEKVIFVIPKRNIETWLRYLDAGAFDEQTDYSNMVHGNDCIRLVKALDEMCRTHNLLPSPPPSLVTACEEYNRSV
jgi:hypothetical protein